MTDKRITDLNEGTVAANSDYLCFVSDPTGTSELKKVTKQNLIQDSNFISAATLDNAIARYDGTAGKLQPSGVTVSDGSAIGAASITFGTSSPLSDYVESYFNPTVMAASGTVPTYSFYLGNYVRIGDRCIADVNILGTGANGNGTGQLSISLPITAGSNYQTLIGYGYALDGNTVPYNLTVFLPATTNGTSATLYYWASSSSMPAFTASMQGTSNAARSIKLILNYRV